MTVGLAMVVRDEERTLPRLLASLPPEVEPDRSLIIDTGSRDGTRRIALEWGASLQEREWVSHARNRTELLAEARGRADYALLLDADMEIEGLALDALEGELCTAKLVQGEFEYAIPVLAHSSREWVYKGVAHAMIEPADGRDVTVQPLSARILDHSKTGPLKIIKDIDALWEQLRSSDMSDARAWYYLGQSYKDLGEKQKALACWGVRANMGGHEEERWQAVYQSGLLVIEDNFQGGVALLMQAYAQRPYRAEPLRAIAAFADAAADQMPFPEGEIMPIRRDMYGPRPPR